MNRLDFDGRHAIVTGGATGLGFAIAQRLIASGGSVTLWDRDAASMARGIEAIAALRDELAALSPVATGELARYFELRNMIDVAEAVTRSALHREESRGAHFRIDFPGYPTGDRTATGNTLPSA